MHMMKDKRMKRKYKIGAIGPLPNSEVSSWARADIYVYVKASPISEYVGPEGISSSGWSFSC